jgi:PAS domain S-box-containing protein
VESQQARYQELFDLAPDAYVVTDTVGAVRESNRAAAALFRIPPGYLDGKPLAVFIEPESRRAFRDCVTTLSSAEGVEHVEMRVHPRYGPPADVSVVAAASRDAAGKVATIRWILRDVTEQRRAAERMRAISISVERRVAERTARLEQMILERDARITVLEAELAAEREARLRADALGARRSDLLGVLSHEIRTPLHASQGYLELLEMTASANLTPEQQSYLAHMHRVQDYLLNILEGVLALSRLERGAADLDLGDVPVNAVLSTIPGLVHPQVIDKQIRYEHRPGDPSVTVFADREKLQQILLNLVTNAAKFTPAGGLVSVSWEASADTIAISVRDTGSGIQAGDLERIFEPFVQVDTVRSGSRRGVGLGLPISRQLARLMGGDVTVVSAPGEGATFTLWLPRYAGAPATGGPASAPNDATRAASAAEESHGDA